MKSIIAIACLLTALLAACSSNDSKAAQLLETARFEEKQNNREHALKLYTEIISHYPGTPSAAQATARLNELKR